MMTDDLVTFLRARLDEDETIAVRAIDPKHRGDWAWRKDSRTTVRTPDGGPIGPEARGVEIGPHIAKWNPARVLREVDAKRTMVDRAVYTWQHSPEYGEANPWRIMLGYLALPYADHPDYRDEWRP